MSGQLPKPFLSTMQGLLSADEYSLFCSEMERPAKTFIRQNRAKVNVEGASEQVVWCSDGLVLSHRPNFTFDPLLHAGAYYVQEQSSMFLHHVLRQVVSEPVLMLDLCAAPGGKTTLALSALPEGSMLVANEPIRQRAQILAENVSKWGLPNVMVCNNMPAELAQTGIQADIVLIDVPCSGEGMFRKDPENIGEWSVQKVEQCQLLQRQIATEAWKCLKPNGILIYSTCTFNTKENEENVAWICSKLGAEIVSVPTPEGWGIGGSRWDGLQERIFRFIPGLHPASHLPSGEGLFMAVMRKTSGQTAVHRQRTTEKRVQVPAEAKRLICNAEAFRFTQLGQHIVALQENLSTVLQQVADKLQVVQAGIMIGQMKGKDLVPAQQLALSTAMRKDSFAQVEVTWETAINYLRREAITLNQAPRGICLLTYQGLPIGFMKNLGNRANNLYPAEWRIRSTHLPENMPDLGLSFKIRDNQ